MSDVWGRAYACSDSAGAALYPEARNFGNVSRTQKPSLLVPLYPEALPSALWFHRVGFEKKYNFGLKFPELERKRREAEVNRYDAARRACKQAEVAELEAIIAFILRG